MVSDKAAFRLAGSRSVTCTVKLKGPGLVAVPDRTPLLERLTPAGKLPEWRLHVYGEMPPEAVSVARYGTPCAPVERVDVVIESVEVMVMLRFATPAWSVL